jgi:putative ABC transport system permease protein
MTVVRGLLQDLRFAVRGLGRNPGFTVVALLVLALGIGGATAIFSVVDALVLRPLPYPADAGALVTIHTRDRQLARLGPLSAPHFADLRAQVPGIARAAIYRQRRLVLTGAGDAEAVNGVITSVDLFGVLGSTPAVGRGFAAGEDEPGRPRLAVLGHGFWRRKLGGDPAVVGKALRLDGEVVTVVGVAPPALRFPLDGPATDLFVTLDGGIDREARRWRSMLPYRSAVARLHPGVDVARVQAELDLLHRRLARDHAGDEAGKVFVAAAMREAAVAPGRRGALVLLGAVGLLLAIACANLASLQLARAAARAPELAIRAALGASRARLARQLVVENVVLSVAGGALGMAAAWLGVDALAAVVPEALARLGEVAVDGRVLAVAAALVVGTGVLVGAAPALAAARPVLQAALAMARTGRVAGRGGRPRAQRALLVAQVALVFVLVVGTGLLARSFGKVAGIDPGFADPAGLLTARIRTAARQVEPATLYRELLARMAALPGARDAALATPLPFQGWFGGAMQFTLSDRQPPPAAAPWSMDWFLVSPGYFRTMGIPLVRGRGFEAAEDQPGGPQVAIVNESFARQHFPDGRDPLGSRILAYNQFDWRIVGVVADTRGGGCPPSGCVGYGQGRLERPPQPEVYTPLRGKAGAPEIHLLVRLRAPEAAGPAAAALPALVRGIDPNVSVEAIGTMDQGIARSLDERRLTLVVIGVFALVALALAALGIYGLLSQSVERRRSEVAIRMALGARAAQVLRLVVGEGLALAVAGLVVGVAAAVALTRVLASQLHGVSATDPLTFAALAALVLAVAAAGCWIPARRAARIDPMVALRQE